jgi:hypothetical protein
MTIAAVLTLSLGVGANTAIFSGGFSQPGSCAMAHGRRGSTPGSSSAGGLASRYWSGNDPLGRRVRVLGESLRRAQRWVSGGAVAVA